MTDESLIRAACENYVRAFLSANSALMKGVFHDDALICGSIAGQDWVGDPAALAAMCDSNPPSAQEVSPGAVSILAIAGSSAAVRLDVKTDAGVKFAEFFVMQKIEDDWRVVGKAFSSV
ncbi:MAG: nuclear transport factor 2 family protein [Parvularculaceae bacterium]